MERALANKHIQRAIAAATLVAGGFFMFEMGQELASDAADMTCNTVNGHYVDDCGAEIQEFQGNGGLLTNLGQESIFAGIMMACYGAYRYGKYMDDETEG